MNPLTHLLHDLLDHGHGFYVVTEYSSLVVGVWCPPLYSEYFLCCPVNFSTPVLGVLLFFRYFSRRYGIYSCYVVCRALIINIGDLLERWTNCIFRYYPLLPMLIGSVFL